MSRKLGYIPGRRIQLSFSGLSAEIAPDGLSESGYVLEIGGAEQSHVDLLHPEQIFYEYLRRIGNLIDVLAPVGEPITVAHLGAGGLTLPRYIQAMRPGSRQVAVEIERELPSFVAGQLPLPEGTRLRVMIDDARAALPRLRAETELAPDEGIDAVVVDIFSGRESPEHLACEEFYRETLPLLSDRGILAVNVGDDAGLAFFAEQVRAIARAWGEFPWVLADASMLDGAREGNLILAVGPGLGCGAGLAGGSGLGAVGEVGPELDDVAERLQAAGPHPGVVLRPMQTEEFLARCGR